MEYRQPQSYPFEDWSPEDPFVRGVIVRIVRYNGTVTIRSTLVDTTPGSSGGMKDAPLMPGKSLYDTLSGKTITLISADQYGAVIEVE
ncbi:MAG: carbohydrate-binding protein [Herbaspirillum sp.]|nr:carbohydrate-binding protein [Herbaspirillum sp.]